MHRVLRVVLSGPVLSAVWLLLCALYIDSQVGWDVLPSLLPHELAITVLGVTAPIAFLWVVTGFYRRAGELAASSALLAERVDTLVFPSEAAEARARAVSESLSAQAENLSGAAIEAVDRIEGVSATLAGRLRDIVTSVTEAAQRVERAEGDLVTVADQVGKLSQALQSHAQAVEQAVQRDLTAATERLAGQVSVVEMTVGRAFAAGGEKVAADAG